MAFGKSLFHAIGRVSLVRQIAAGLALGIVIGSVSPQLGLAAGLFGSLFVGALKAVAPVLVFILVAATIAQHQKGNKAHIRPIIVLYLIGTFSAALTAVIAGMVFPTHIVLAGAGDVSAAPPSGIVEVLKSLLMNLVANPINAIANANYIGILAWALVLGAALRNHGSDVTRQVVADLAEAVSTVVKWIIRFAPLGIFGLVSSTIAETGFGALAGYAKLLAVLLGCMVFIALVVNPPSCGGKSAATLIRWCLPACAKAACMPSLPVLPPPISP
ncbi:serine/threonine transporter SstT [Neisseria meningitidis]|nr:serine/threonine transporter SstT [Neisseria meningitidis]